MTTHVKYLACWCQVVLPSKRRRTEEAAVGDPENEAMDAEESQEEEEDKGSNLIKVKGKMSIMSQCLTSQPALGICDPGQSKTETRDGLGVSLVSPCWGDAMVVSCFGPSEWGFIQSSDGQPLGETVSAPKCFGETITERAALKDVETQSEGHIAGMGWLTDARPGDNDASTLSFLQSDESKEQEETRKPGHSGHSGHAGRGPTAPSHSPTSLMATGSNVWAWKSWMGSEHQLGTSKSDFRLWAPAAPVRPAPTESLPHSLPHSLPQKLPSCFPSSKSVASNPAQTAPCLLPLERRPLREAGPGSASPWSSPSHASHVSHASEPQELRAASPSASCGSVSPMGAPETPPTRIAVVGAGPVGLWIAVLLARAHARIFQTSTGFRISRHPQAPVINVFERRSDSSGWGSRWLPSRNDGTLTERNVHATYFIVSRRMGAQHLHLPPLPLAADYSPARRVARATCDKPLQRCVSTPNISRRQVVKDEEEDPEVISLDGCDLFPKRTTNVTFQETVEVYHFEPVDPELLKKVSQRSLEDLTINQRVAEMARNHEKIVAQMPRFTANSMCSDGLDAWFAALPLFGEVSEKNWERLELDYDMEAWNGGFDGQPTESDAGASSLYCNSLPRCHPSGVLEETRARNRSRKSMAQWPTEKRLRTSILGNSEDIDRRSLYGRLTPDTPAEGRFLSLSFTF
eukprot:s1358_g14.t1